MSFHSSQVTPVPSHEEDWLGAASWWIPKVVGDLCCLLMNQLSGGTTSFYCNRFTSQKYSKGKANRKFSSFERVAGSHASKCYEQPVGVMFSLMLLLSKKLQ